jgi:aspartyl-tRNA synthetase
VLRDVSCGELRAKDSGRNVTIAGWVRKIRDHGEIIFIDLWDRYGITQIVFSPEDGALKERAKKLGLEWVIKVGGEVRKRPEEMVNPDIATGEIEVKATTLEVLNAAEVPPFVVQENLTAEKELRLKYRYLELRRSLALKGFILRHKLMQSAREFLNENNFLEVETPILAKSTPEGARDFLVSSRMNPGKFYSLAQSPQLYKQILMIAGFDRYYQFARCFRDEDMRGDRQLEHTQIDIEMAYPECEDIYELCEGLMSSMLEKGIGEKPSVPFPRMTYKEAMERYGTDKPDLRNPLVLNDYTKIAKSGNFGIFNQCEVTRGINIKRLFTRKEIGELEEVVKKAGAKGLLYIMNDGGKFRAPFEKYFENISGFGVKEGETLLLVSGKEKEVLVSLGVLRCELGNRYNLLDEGWRFLWVTDFPLFEWDEEENRWAPVHHIFTQAIGDLRNIENDPGSVLGKLYDLVLNGVELGSGSIRNHNPDVQRRLLNVIGMTDEEADEKFGFLLTALSYGAPPHGGIALGFDRICRLLAGLSSITEVITFPKTLTGAGLMEESPSVVPKKDLKELKLEGLEE